MRDHPPTEKSVDVADLALLGQRAADVFRHLGEACRAAETACLIFANIAEGMDGEAAETDPLDDLPPGDPLAHARSPEEAPAPKPPAADKPVKTGKPQVFKSNSFWRVVDGGDIFQCDGGTEAPAKNDADYVKITRDEFAQLKRDGADVLVWPLETASEPPAAEDDEDDGAGLI